MMYGWNAGMGWGFGGILFFIILVTGLIIGIVFLVRWLAKQNERSGRNELPRNAQETLKDRYARGEISREEYLQAKSDLED